MVAVLIADLSMDLAVSYQWVKVPRGCHVHFFLFYLPCVALPAYSVYMTAVAPFLRLLTFILASHVLILILVI